MNRDHIFNTNVLAIDFGTKRIGLARSYGTLAEPLKIVPYTQNKPETAISHILSICESEIIEQIIVGISENDTAVKTREFIGLLKQHTTIPIEKFDETLSSQEARARIARKHRSKKNDIPIDHYAAAIFLQEWLDIQ